MTDAPRPRCERAPRVAGQALRSMAASEKSAFDAHVDACTECREELAAVLPILDQFVDCLTDILTPPAPLWGPLAEVAPGISVKILSTDTAADRVTMLVRLAPGVAYAPHTHAGLEELHLLDGELWVDERKLWPGDHNRAEPGTGDVRVWSETGCTCVLVTSSRDLLR